MKPLPTNLIHDRARRALKIMASPYLYKLCEGCDSIVTLRVANCPNCHGYRFRESPGDVIRQARLLASREQRSVTASDLIS
jgi:hypothetical protein